MIKNQTITSECVGNGHPDKIADAIADGILSNVLAYNKNAKCGIEVMVKDNIVILGGEINTKYDVAYDEVVRETFKQLAFPENHHLEPENIKIINLIGKQSEEIHSGVVHSDGELGAGDQGFAVGYANNETPSYMPLGIDIARKLCVAVNKVKTYGPDCKSQVSVSYDKNGKSKIESVLISTLHQNSLAQCREDIKKLAASVVGKGVDITVNPCGEWHTGGSVADCGVTGRKLVCDQYGGYCNIGGGNLSGKDMSKIDRSAAYMCRWLAKNIVATKLTTEAKVELSYMIGVAKPSAINIVTDDAKLTEACRIVFEKIDMTPGGIIERFGKRPPLNAIVVNGNFGLDEYPWEKIDDELVSEIKFQTNGNSK